MMKSILLVVSTLLVATSAKGIANANIPLNGDFLVGFETGIFLRKTLDQVNEYKCPKAEIKIEEFRKMKEMIPGIINIIGVMQKDEDMQHMLESLNVFVNHLDEIVGVFESDYNGGDFCAGLSFGYSGSNMLYSIAETIIHQSIKDMKERDSAHKN